MSPARFEFKVVIAGPFGVGKTSLITNVSNVAVVGTEVPTTGDEAAEKDSTTVGLEYGLHQVRTADFEIDLLLYGTPGQRRFRFMYDMVSVGADGFIVLVDATRPETWDEALETVTYFAERHEAPCVIGANRTASGTDSFERLTDHFSNPTSPVVACNVTEQVSASDLMVSLLERLLDEDPADAHESIAI